MNHPLQWKKYPVLNDGFICLVDVMGDDSSIVQAARVSYGKDEREVIGSKLADVLTQQHSHLPDDRVGYLNKSIEEIHNKDRQLIRYLLNHSHTTPFEMVEFKFLVRVPMDCWRQWIRHRTANVNEYSTRYTEAIDSQQTTSPEEWRLQATDNKQGSSGYLEEWPQPMIVKDSGGEYPDSYYIDTGYGDEYLEPNEYKTPGEYLSKREAKYHQDAQELYQERLKAGVAKEQARKDLPLSTYTEAYWKCDLHNIFNFLRLRMDSHAQLEIRSYAKAMAEIVKQVCPIAWEAFEDYVLYAKKFSRMEMEILRTIASQYIDSFQGVDRYVLDNKPESMTDREWKEFLNKLT